jgi:hypothetical protein
MEGVAIGLLLIEGSRYKAWLLLLLLRRRRRRRRWHIIAF